MMLKKLMISNLFLATFMAAATAGAGEIQAQKIDQSVKDVFEMKSYDGGGIRIFLVDEQEPAARPMKVVVTLPQGGDEFAEYQSYDLGNHCSVDLSKATTKTRMETWKVRSIMIPVTYYNPENGKCEKKDTLTVEAKLMDDSESSIKASTGLAQ